MLRATPPKEFIQTYRPGGKRGVLLEKRLYERFSFFIFETLEKGEEITFQTLLDNCIQSFCGAFEEDLGWCFLQVKLDLEARGFIKTYNLPHKKRVICIRLTRMGSKKLRARKPVLKA